jgi:cytochrome b561
MNTHFLIGLLIAVYVCWRVYMRLRRTIGEQAFRPRRLKFSIAVFSLLSLLILLPTLGQAQLLLGWAAGLAGGLALGWWALRLTHFSTIASGRFYTPNAHLGIGLTLLFVIRIVYRVVALYNDFTVAGRPVPGWGESALTYLTFELLAGYYIAHSAGVLAHYARDLEPPAPIA